jgi:hypothetical protein
MHGAAFIFLPPGTFLPGAGSLIEFDCPYLALSFPLHSDI